MAEDVGTLAVVGPAGSNRPARVRCVHCAMPVRAEREDCWGCGRHPSDEASEVVREVQGDAALGSVKAKAPGLASVRFALVGAAALLLVVVVAGAVLILVPSDRNTGVRRFADTIRGDAWRSVEQHGYEVDFPSKPTESAAPALAAQPAPGTPLPVRQLVADDGALRYHVIEFALPAPAIDPMVVLKPIVDHHANAIGGTVQDQAPVPVLGIVGVDATVVGPTRSVRIRAGAVGTRVFAFVQSGPAASLDPEAFERFAASFRLLGS